MKIIVVDGFKMIDPSESGALLVESDRVNEYLDYAARKKLTKISLQAYHGFKLQNIDFFKEYNFFTEVSVIQDLSEIDISGVHFLKDLERLTLSNNKQRIDFASFPRLVHASIDWNESLVNMGLNERFKSLILSKYKPKSGSFSELSDLHELDSLEITQSNLVSLSGIEDLHHLREFKAYYLTKLESLKGITALNEVLALLELGNCKKLKGYEVSLRELVKLEKLIISNCGDLNDLNFITQMPFLKFFSFYNTNIKDGNLNILKQKSIEYVGYDDKKRYSHKMKDINPNFKWKV
jgi:hypothetical protein